MNNDELAELIRNVSIAVNSTGQGGIEEAVLPLRGIITPNCHEGRGSEMDATDVGYRLQIEWYAGQLLSMVDKKQFYGINSWINLTDKFTTRKEDEDNG
jgi:hypothetical protein